MNSIQRFFVSLFALLGIAAWGAGQTSPYVPGEVLVKFRPGYESQRPLVHSAVGGTIKKELSQLKVELVQLPAGMSVQQGIALYGSVASVLYAEPNYKKQLLYVPNDTYYGQLYGATQMRLPEAWDVTKGAGTVKIAILDSGVDIRHPDLDDHFAGGHDFNDGDGDPTPYYFHGTHVAGTAAAETDNNLGVSGMGFDCKYLGVAIVLTVAGSAEAMTWAADNGADVINMSYGGYGQSSTEENAVNYAWNSGVLLVAAAGNDNVSQPLYPASFEKVLSVGATGPNGLKASFSNYGPTVDVAGPGVNILSCNWPGNGYVQSSGTSMASPGVAGVAGLLFAFGAGTVTNVEVRLALESTAVNIGTWLQYGRVDAAAALAAIRPITPIDLSPATVTVYEGTYAGGNIASLVNSDNNYYEVNTQTIARLGPTASVIVEFDVPFSPQSLRSTKLIVEASGANLSTNFLYFWNPTQARWVSYRQFGLRTTDTVFQYDMGTGLRQYIANGKVKMLSRANISLRRPGAWPFGYRIDRIRLENRVQS